MKSNRIAVTSSLLLLAPLAAQAPIALVPAVGAKASFVQKTNQTQLIATGGEEAEVKQVLTQEFTLEVTAVGADGARTVKIAFGRVQGAFTMPGQDEVTFDSGKKVDGAEGAQAAVALLPGKEFTAKVGADGAILECSGLGDTAKQAREAAGAQAQMLESVLADRALGHLARAALGPLPKAPVAVGATWERTEESGNAILLERALKCTLTKADATTAEIAVTGTIAAKKGGKGPMADAKVEDGKYEAKTTVSLQDALPTHTETKSSLSVIAQMMGNELAMDLDIQVTIDRAAPTDAAAKPTK